MRMRQSLDIIIPDRSIRVEQPQPGKKGVGGNLEARDG